MKILYFASLREQLGLAEETVTEVVANVDELILLLSNRGDIWTNLLKDNLRLQIAVNQSLARRHTTLSPDDEVAFFPPVTGG
jgi:molybdopterin synthase sulfur carrier subunit